MFFAGFTLDRVDVGEAERRVRHGGSGPPLLLLHGHPRTHATWHKVARPLHRGLPGSARVRSFVQTAHHADHEPYSNGPWPATASR